MTGLRRGGTHPGNRPARVLNPANAPQNLHFAKFGTVDVSREVVQASRAAVGNQDPDSLTRAIKDLKALLGRVIQCRAIDPDDIVPVASHSELYELRVNDQANGVHLRIYVAELAALPHDLIALHAHQKLVSGSPAVIRAAQNQAINVAVGRLGQGRQVRWGLP